MGAYSGTNTTLAKFRSYGNEILANNCFGGHTERKAKWKNTTWTPLARSIANRLPPDQRECMLHTSKLLRSHLFYGEVWNNNFVWTTTVDSCQLSSRQTMLVVCRQLLCEKVAQLVVVEQLSLDDSCPGQLYFYTTIFQRGVVQGVHSLAY